MGATADRLYGGRGPSRASRVRRSVPTPRLWARLKSPDRSTAAASLAEASATTKRRVVRVRRAPGRDWNGIARSFHSVEDANDGVVDYQSAHIAELSGPRW